MSERFDLSELAYTLRGRHHTRKHFKKVFPNTLPKDVPLPRHFTGELASKSAESIGPVGILGAG